MARTGSSSRERPGRQRRGGNSQGTADLFLAVASFPSENLEPTTENMSVVRRLRWKGRRNVFHLSPISWRLGPSVVGNLIDRHVSAIDPVSLFLR